MLNIYSFITIQLLFEQQQEMELLKGCVGFLSGLNKQMAVTRNFTPNTGFLCSLILHFLDISLTFAMTQKYLSEKARVLGGST